MMRTEFNSNMDDGERNIDQVKRGFPIQSKNTFAVHEGTLQGDGQQDHVGAQGDVRLCRALPAPLPGARYVRQILDIAN